MKAIAAAGSHESVAAFDDQARETVLKLGLAVPVAGKQRRSIPARLEMSLTFDRRLDAGVQDEANCSLGARRE